MSVRAFRLEADRATIRSAFGTIRDAARTLHSASERFDRGGDTATIGESDTRSFVIGCTRKPRERVENGAPRW